MATASRFAALLVVSAVAVGCGGKKHAEEQRLPAPPRQVAVSSSSGWTAANPTASAPRELIVARTDDVLNFVIIPPLREAPGHPTKIAYDARRLCGGRRLTGSFRNPRWNVRLPPGKYTVTFTWPGSAHRYLIGVWVSDSAPHLVVTVPRCE